MKLILCPHCQDIRKLLRAPTHCQCGKSGGRYEEDRVHATIWGAAVPLGFANDPLADAVRKWLGAGCGNYPLVAFTIPIPCPTVKKVERASKSKGRGRTRKSSR